jgi:hypothetical protein
MHLKQITLSPKAARLLDDLVEAYDEHVDVLADMLGYNDDRLDEGFGDLHGALAAGKLIPVSVQVMRQPLV